MHKIVLFQHCTPTKKHEHHPKQRKAHEANSLAEARVLEQARHGLLEADGIYAQGLGLARRWDGRHVVEVGWEGLPLDQELALAVALICSV